MAEQETPQEKLERRSNESLGRPDSPKSKNKPKKPQDHKSKKPKPDDKGYVKVKHKGVDLRINAKLDPQSDYELLIELEKAQEGSVRAMDTVFRAMVHPADFPALLEAYRDEGGKVDPNEFLMALPELQEAAGLGNS